MNRKVNIITNESQSIKDIENIAINNLDSVFSYSCELLVCKNFNIFEEDSVQQAFTLLFDKVRPQGQLILGVYNLRQVCENYLTKKMNNKNFFEYMKNIHNHFGLDDVISVSENLPNTMIADIRGENDLTYITIIKTQP